MGALEKSSYARRRNVLVGKSFAAVLDNQRRLATLEPRLNLAMLSLTLVTSSRSLSMPRGRTSSHALLLLDGAFVVRQVAQDRGMASLRHGQRGHASRQRRNAHICLHARPAHGRDGTRRKQPRRHCRPNWLFAVVNADGSRAELWRWIFYGDGDRSFQRPTFIVRARPAPKHHALPEASCHSQHGQYN